MDPTENVKVADLKEALDMQVKLRDMQSNINMSLRFLDSIKEQLKQAQTTMKGLQKEPDKNLMKTLEDYIKEVDKLLDQLSARNEGQKKKDKEQENNNNGKKNKTLDTN